MTSLIEKVIGTKSERQLKKLKPIVQKINDLEKTITPLTDEQLKNKTQEFKDRLAKGQTLEDILPEAFAVVREAAKRVLGLRHYDVQLLGGMVLHQGKIAEMRTGEGKTLVATLPSYLNALTGKGVHVVTVNDYLAKRDREWMGPVHEFLGLSVGYINHDMDNAQRQEMYKKDITYVTNNELGFDYLRDNMVVRAEDRVQRPLNFCIVDEVDSILIDEARTPLIISGPTDDKTDKYYIVNRLVPQFKVRKITERDEVNAKYAGEDLAKGYDALIDEKNQTVTLTDQGVAAAEKMLGIPNLYNDVSAEWVHHINQALRAHHLYKREDHYIVKNGEVIIVDEFTGRLMPGRRWSDGLHQAIEAKEHIAIKEENQTLATITFQNFFKLYKKLSGMTGTAMTEATEFWEIYKLDVVEIPSNKPCQRIDYPDIIYRTEDEKFDAVVAEIERLWRKGLPVLVGTRSIEKSEHISEMLRRKAIPHKVLNAKYHEMEAQIISQAGRKGAVTIATNMAGRGTDIVLGGNPVNKEEQDFIEANGGLNVIGTERHESRRIDNQLRGRCARQGDKGSSRFYVALNDELMRLFGSEKISTIMGHLGMKKGEALESSLLSSQIARAQRRVEGHNFDIRKHLLDYDKVMNQQRTAVYNLRNAILDGENFSDRTQQMIAEMAADLFYKFYNEKHPARSDFNSINTLFKRIFTIEVNLDSTNIKSKKADALLQDLTDKAIEACKQRAAYFKEQGIDFSEIERMLLLQLLDQAWKQHLYELDQMQKSINLRAYGQKDPLIEYQKESYSLYLAMMNRIRDLFVEYIFRLQLPPQRRPVQQAQQQAQTTDGKTQEIHKIGRNDLCPCGSGKKYKKCCGK